LDKQHVCLVCGYNMVGYFPIQCPFCGADRVNFITANECSERFKVVVTPVTERVERLNSSPALGLEHAAYRVETDKSSLMIDCPSAFDPTILPVDHIIFTHHHFLGASNLYRDKLGAMVSIHRLDSHNDLTKGFVFDDLFDRGFVKDGLEAYPIDGHTTGFTFYIFDEVLFICDYVFLKNGRVRKFNRFGPAEKTATGGQRLLDLLAGRSVTTVCGYNYVTSFERWVRGVESLLGM
jgi:hydroxyacylglutathione hydrolase